MVITKKTPMFILFSLVLVLLSNIYTSSTLQAEESDCDFCPGNPISVVTESLHWFGIQRVVFNDIDNGPTTVEQAYQDFTYLPTDVIAGHSYKLYVFVDNLGGWKSYIRAWFDWNHDCDFDDANELWDIGLDQLNFNPPDPYCDYDTIRVYVPWEAINGNTIMRVRTEAETFPAPEPCGAVNYGEAEDYTINVTGGVSCEEGYHKPGEFFTLTNHPNPFNSKTTFAINLPEADEVSLEIHSLDGKLMDRVFDNKLLSRGMHKIDYRFDSAISSGIYFAVLKTSDSIPFSKSILFLK